MTPWILIAVDGDTRIVFLPDGLEPDPQYLAIRIPYGSSARRIAAYLLRLSNELEHFAAVYPESENGDFEFGKRYVKSDD